MYNKKIKIKMIANKIIIVIKIIKMRDKIY